MSWHWLERADLDAILANASDVNGPATVGDEEALAAVLQEPPRSASKTGIDVFVLAAAYAGAIIRRAPFQSGNSAVAVAAASAFLERNGQVVTKAPDIRSSLAAALSAGGIDEAEIADWLRRHTAPPADSFLVPEQDG